MHLFLRNRAGLRLWRVVVQRNWVQRTHSVQGPPHVFLQASAPFQGARIELLIPQSGGCGYTTSKLSCRGFVTTPPRHH